MNLPAMEFIHQPAPSNRLGDYLKINLAKPWTHFRAAVAFVKRSGTRHIREGISGFAQTGHVEIIAGIDHRGTSEEGLRDLLDAASPNGRVIVFHNRMPFTTFHPKVYLFKSPEAAELLIGSGNLTEGGLFNNYEASIRLTFNLTEPDKAAILQFIELVLDTWADMSSGTAHVLDGDLLARLIAHGLVPPEALATPETEVPEIHPTAAAGGMEPNASASDETGAEHVKFLFTARAEPRAPPFPRPAVSRTEPPADTTHQAAARADSSKPILLNATGFVMTLHQTDVGVGQTTAGASRRSPEIFVPLSARNANPDFWNWPNGFAEDPMKPGKLDRRGVRMRLGADIVEVNMMTWPDKHDFRLRSEAIRSTGNIGDILRLEKVGSDMDFDYYAEIIPHGTSQHPIYLGFCRQPVPNSDKRYGYY